MIELHGVTKLYGTVIGVNDITLSLAPGVYGLLGPNGSGKTTLLNLITGQLKPTLGELRVFGQRPWNCDALFARLGLCPAQEIQYSNVSGFQWVRYLLQMQGYRAADADERAEQVLQQVGMGSAMHRRIGTYSKGMRQRTKLAQAIAHKPDLLVLDEPFNGLDPIGRHDMTELLREWTRDRSLIVASHILHEIEEISTSFLLILGGRLLASGEAEEVSSLLADLPCEIRLHCDRPRELAQWLLEESLAHSVRIDEQHRLAISTVEPARLARRVPQWCQTRDLKVYEMHSASDSLQLLFNSLTRRHRGESL